MAYNFIPCARDQAFLPPPDVRDWLPADHIAWFVLDVVDQLDLGPFLAAYRADGHGRAAYDPRVLLAVLLYGYCTGIRSSRQIERRCREDIAFRVLSANSAPDHVTIARFRARHEQALAGLLVASLKLCAAAGLVRLGTVALDGTKLAANAAAKPTAPATSSGRLARLHAAKARLDAEAAEREQTYQARVAASIAKATAAGRASKVSYRYRPRDEAPRPDATANTTDPDSRRMHGRHGSVQGYNAQAIATTDQIIIAAGLTQTSNDLQQLAPMLTTTRTTLAAAGITSRPEVLLADSGYQAFARGLRPSGRR
jgi:transposase